MKFYIPFIAFIFFLSTNTIGQERKNSKKKTTKENVIAEEIADSSVSKKTGPGSIDDLKGEWIMTSDINSLNSKKIQASKVMVTSAEPILDNDIISSETPSKTGNIESNSQKAENAESEKNILPEERPSLLFNAKDGTLSGYSGCNNFTAKIIVNTDSIKIKEISINAKVDCKNQFQEDLFFQGLRRVKTFKLNDGAIEFYNGEKILMVFEKSSRKK